MAGKPDIKRLLSKGLSGLEAGKLVLLDIYEEEHGREGFLSDKDIQQLKAGLKTQPDGQDYNRMVDLYKAVYMTVQEARIASLHLQRLLASQVSVLLQAYVVSTGIRMVYRQLPLIVTEKEYAALKKRQKATLRKRLYSLAQVREWRTRELLGGWDKAEEATDEAYAEAEAKAEQEVQQLIEAGKLEPIRLGHKASLMTVQEAEEAKANPLEYDPEDLSPAMERLLYEKEYGDLSPEELADKKEQQVEYSKTLRADYLKRVEASLAQGDLTEGHDVEWWPDRGVEPEDEERLLHHYVFGDQLYKAGLPEWRRWIEEFKVYQIPGAEDRDRLAILQEDVSMGGTDRKGYYDTGWMDMLQDYLHVQRMETDFSSTGSETLEEKLRGRVKLATDLARVLLAFVAVLKEAYAVAGLPQTVEEDVYFGDVESEVETYSTLAKGAARWDAKIRSPRLPALDLAKLKPDRTTLATLRERVARGVYIQSGGGGLGPNWWRSISGATEDQEEASDG